jgi:hypothetical protein
MNGNVTNDLEAGNIMQTIRMKKFAKEDQNNDNGKPIDVEYSTKSENPYKPTGHVATDGSILEPSLVQAASNKHISSSFAKTDSPEEQLTEIVANMSWWQKYLYDRGVDRLKREEADKIVRMLMDYQVQVTQHKLTLAFDMEKKRTFVAYLHASSELQKELFTLDADARKQLGEALFVIDKAIYESRQRNREKIESMHMKGIISTDEASEEFDKSDAVSRRLIEDSSKTLYNLWANIAKLLEMTLTVFAEKLAIENKL